MQIQQHLIVRSFGTLLATVIALPSVAGCLYFLLHPTELAANPLSAAMCVLIAVPVLFFTYRWVTLKASADEQTVLLRGLLTTLSIPASQLHRVREVTVRSTDGSSGSTRWSREWQLVGPDDQLPGMIPPSIGTCHQWSEFLQHLQNLAARSRKSHYDNEGVCEPRNLLDLPVEDWTAEDIERWEAGDN